MARLVNLTTIFISGMTAALSFSLATRNISMLIGWLGLERYPSAYWWWYWIGWTLLDIMLLVLAISLAVYAYLRSRK